MPSPLEEVTERLDIVIRLLNELINTTRNEIRSSKPQAQVQSTHLGPTQYCSRCGCAYLGGHICSGRIKMCG